MLFLSLAEAKVHRGLPFRAGFELTSCLLRDAAGKVTVRCFAAPLADLP